MGGTGVQHSLCCFPLAMRAWWVLALACAPLMAFAAQCGPDSKCPRDSPCCSATGECGSGAVQCAAGCNPLYSFSSTSCAANPICTNMNVTIPQKSFNSTNVFVPIATYNGDPSQGVFTFESGYLGTGSQGVLLEMNKGHASRIATSRYMLFGNIEARLKHDPQSGLVTTFGTLSDIGDAIQWQFGGRNGSQASANYFAMNNQTNPVGAPLSLGKGFSVSDFHTYGIRWAPDSIQWVLDNKTVHTVQRAKAGKQYPRSPSRVVFTAWGVSQGTNKALRKWANGALSFTSSTYNNMGFYAQELTNLQISCANLALSNVSTTGGGSDVTSYFYTGKNSTNSGEPEFELTRDPIRLISNPAQDSPDDAPGSPNLGQNGPMANMFAGGTQGTQQKTSAPVSDDSTSNKVKIGVPAGIGGAVVLGLLILLAVYLVRRAHKKPPPPPPMSEVGSMYAPPPLGIYSPNERQPVQQMSPYAMPYDSATHSEHIAPSHSQATTIHMPASDDTELTDEKGAYLEEEEEEPVEDVYSDEASSERHSFDSDSSNTRQRMHYAARNVRRYDARLTKEQKDELAAQEAWDELRYAALGDENGTYFHARSVSSPQVGASPHMRSRAKYSRGGAHVPSASVSGRSDRADTSDYRSLASHSRRRSHFPSDEL